MSQCDQKHIEIGKTIKLFRAHSNFIIGRFPHILSTDSLYMYIHAQLNASLFCNKTTEKNRSLAFWLSCKNSVDFSFSLCSSFLFFSQFLWFSFHQFFFAFYLNIIFYSNKEKKQSDVKINCVFLDSFEMLQIELCTAPAKNFNNRHQKLKLHKSHSNPKKNNKK